MSEFLRGNLDETTTILELGCGTARNLENIRSMDLKFKKYLGLDFSPSMLDVARSKFPDNPSVEFRKQDITTLDCIKEKFDIILCTRVLSHLSSPSSLVNCALGFLKENGRFFLIFFTTPKWYVNIWLYPVATYLFSAKPVVEEEVRKFKNIKARHNYASNITSYVEIHEW